MEHAKLEIKESISLSDTPQPLPRGKVLEKS